MGNPMEHVSHAAASGVVGGLADVLEALGKELREANDRIKESQDKPVLALNTAEVELSLALQADGKGGVRFWVVEAGGGMAAEKSATVRINMVSWEHALPVGM